MSTNPMHGCASVSRVKSTVTVRQSWMTVFTTACLGTKAAEHQNGVLPLLPLPNPLEGELPKERRMSAVAALSAVPVSVATAATADAAIHHHPIDQAQEVLGVVIEIAVRVGRDHNPEPTLAVLEIPRALDHEVVLGARDREAISANIS